MVAGMAFWVMVTSPWIPGVEPNKADPGFGERAIAAEGAAPNAFDDVALQYVRAYQESDCGAVVDLTWWMKERIAYATKHQGRSEADVRAGLCGAAMTRSPEGNRITPEGIEDQYIFRPGADVTFVGRDPGTEGLAKGTAQRTWLRVNFADESRAPFDSGKRPIRGLTVGVNVSEDGYILKAGIVGNLDIAHETVTTNWTGGK